MLSFTTRAMPPARLLRPRQERHQIVPAASATRAVRATRRSEFPNFGEFCNALYTKGGVLAALPPVALPLATSALEKNQQILGLDSSSCAGSARWWSQRLLKAKYCKSFKQGLALMYHVDGLEKNEWFPRHTDVDEAVIANGWDYLTLGGFSVAVRALPSKEALSTSVISTRFVFETEAAAEGVAPAIFAGFVTPDTAVYGQVCVTQRHLFRLSDLLREYARFEANDLLRPGMASIDASVYELTAAVAKKVRRLAEKRLLKMNLIADNVVFCPHLVEDESGAMVSTGYGFGRLEVKGVPFLSDFDPIYTKRVPADGDATVDALYQTMMHVLLGSVRAEFGDVYRIMLNKLTGRTPDGKRMVPVDELPEHFERIDVRRTATGLEAVAKQLAAMPGYGKLVVSSPAVAPAFQTAAEDVVHVGASLRGQAEDTERPIFADLISCLLETQRCDTKLQPTGEAARAAARESFLLEMQLAAVREAREARRRSMQPA